MNSNFDEYSASKVRKTVWGETSKREDGRWETVWSIDFVGMPEVGEVVIYRDDSIGYDATLKVAGEARGELRVATSSVPMDPTYYPATWKALEIVNDSIEEIRSIQGLPRDWYAPFRNRGQ
ncbi:hypothetical protein [Nocardia huaxiensis]|uniref:hypothetical protein n=1 Tax=Nocardia huaxiensis TaxID=2755382 RepID=UPI001E41F9A9|nr:hypothetical protein [Nocardia huaxiensis]UFS96292.1 hypothetical protein LPY97_37645 [Nocardia huaxiensis]